VNAGSQDTDMTTTTVEITVEQTEDIINVNDQRSQVAYQPPLPCRILLEQWRRHDDSISFDLVNGSVRTQQSKKAA
jgi:hypothetical protein